MPSSISFLRLLAIAFALFLLASCRTTQIPVSSEPQDLAQNVLNSLRHRNVDEFMQFVMTPVEFKAHLDSYPDAGGRQPFSKEEILEEWKKDREGMPERFRCVIRDGEKQHIIWANVLFVRAETKLENEGGRLTSDYIDIIFLHNGVLYRVRLDDCIKGPQGWLMADKIIWKGGG